MLFFLFYITKSLSYLIFEQTGRINNTLHIDLNIKKDEKKLLEIDFLWIDFQFDFPTPLQIQIHNGTIYFNQSLKVELEETKYGLFICNDFQIPNQKTEIILNPIQQYQNQWYKYKIQVNEDPRFLTRFQSELGFTKNSSKVIYNLNMTFETSGIYQIEINYKYGSGYLELKTCRRDVCQNQINETILLFNFSQIECLLIQQVSFEDLCSHQLKVTTNNATFYYLTLKHYSSPNVQFIKSNKITQIEILNKEAALLLDDLKTLNFIYFNQKIKAIQFFQNSRKPFEDNVIILKKEEQNLQDWDQNFYIQSFQHSNLNLQFINTIHILYLNSNIRLEQEEDSYQFYCVETIFPEFIFEIYIYDYEILVQIYFSNSTQFPNEHQNQFELIESNFKAIQMKGNNKMYIGIKTKQKTIEYQLNILEPTLFYLNLFQKRKVKYCKSCQIDFKYISQSKEEIQFHFYTNQMKFEEDDSLFEINFVRDGSFIKPLQVYHSKNYVRYSLLVDEETQYTIITKSRIQQELELMITNQKILEIAYDQDIKSIDVTEEIFKIKNPQNNICYLYFKEDIEEKIQIINTSGNQEFKKIASNYYEVEFINTQQEDVYIYFKISGLNSKIAFQVQEKGIETIKNIPNHIFQSPLQYKQQVKILILDSQILDCQNLKCDELTFSKILIITKIGYRNKSIYYTKGYYNLSQYHLVLNDLYEPIQNISTIQLIASINENTSIFNFSSNTFQLFLKNQIMLEKQEPKLKNLLFGILYIVFIIFILYIVFKLVRRRKVSKSSKRTQDQEDEEESIKIDDL